MKTEIDKKTGIPLICFREYDFNSCSECNKKIRKIDLDGVVMIVAEKIFADINNEIGRARLENNIRSTIYHRLDNIKKKYLGDKDEW